MTKEATFKPIDFEHRGTRYQKHHHKMVGGSKRFISDTACPKCSEYLRVWRSQKDGSKTSACMGCHTDKKIKTSRYLNKNKSITIEQRRAIEAHQERTKDLDWEFM
tara:strand:+ start:13259 stop:13576 length:318 start_codon:yes stop_codon:yes gene_type:complete